VITALIDDLPDLPVHTRVELRSIRARVARLYQLPDPGAPASEVDVAQEMAEEDGEILEDAP